MRDDRSQEHQGPERIAANARPSRSCSVGPYICAIHIVWPSGIRLKPPNDTSHPLRAAVVWSSREHSHSSGCGGGARWARRCPGDRISHCRCRRA
jgi:hypothetical protein